MGKRHIDFKLYLITNRKLFCDEDSFFRAVEGALKGGVKAVQLREKDLHARELIFIAYRMRALTSEYGAKLFINDRVDMALCTGADGCHLGKDGMPAYAARKIAGDDFLIGVSAHSLKEACLAEKDGADFITFGPVYETPSKLKYGPPVGLEAMRKVAEEIGIPVFGIGGIRSAAVKAVMEAGAYGAAVISGILAAADIQRTSEEYLKIINSNMSL